MDLHPTRDHDEISESAAEYLTRELPADRCPKQTETALTPLQWQGLADMGWFAMGLPEEVGGLAMSVVEEALVQREFGRNLLPPSTLATMLAGHLALALGQADEAGAFASGARRAAVAVPMGADSADGPATGGYRLVDTNRADVAIGWSSNGAFLAPLGAFGNRQVVAPLDATLEISTAAALDVSRASWLKAADGGFNARARILTAAVLTGGAEAVRDISSDYAKVRHQFGKPIGSFQAIAHPLADMAVRCEASLACVLYAAVCGRDGLPERDLYAASARSVAYHACYSNSASSMQVHGGYGQTYEYMPHFYLKRAMIYGLVGGGVETDEAEIYAAESVFS
jgi:alkylation response protein AidB-like acyl-CoA dehydrogenase